MANYWIKDSSGGVLGPVGLQVLKDVAQQVHLTRESLASRDGAHWVPLAQLPELAKALLTPSQGEQLDRERSELNRLLGQLARFRTMSTWELLGVPTGSSMETCREAFLAMRRHYNPGQLSASASSELRDAYLQTYRHLTERLKALEQSPQAAPGLSLTDAPPRALPQQEPPQVRLIRRNSQEVEARIHVSRANAAMFAEHKLTHIGMGGFFLAAEVLPLGTRLELQFLFVEPPPLRELKARGTVILENAQDTPRDRAGSGIRLERLSKEDRGFILEYVRRASTVPG
jgi:hypothetical protein